MPICVQWVSGRRQGLFKLTFLKFISLYNSASKDNEYVLNVETETVPTTVLSLTEEVHVVCNNIAEYAILKTTPI